MILQQILLFVNLRWSRIYSATEEGMKRERNLSILLVLFSVLAAAGPCPSMAQQPIRIGASIAITGRDQVQGGYVREGYLLCQKHVNDKGGVLGRPIELLIRDDG